MLYINRYHNEIIIMSHGNDQLWLKTIINLPERSFTIERNDGFIIESKESPYLLFIKNNIKINIILKPFQWGKKDEKLEGLSYCIDAPRDIIIERSEINNRKLKNPRKPILSYDEIARQYSEQLAKACL